MLFCNCICAWQPLRVVHGDGHVRRVSAPVTVGELLKGHPHHFVCEPTSTGPLYHSGMLPVDMELEEGRIYLLLPLPRLLPHLASTPSCPCFSQCRPRDSMPFSDDTAAPHYDPLQGKTTDDKYPSPLDSVQQQAGEFLVVATSMRTLTDRVAKSKLVRSLAGMSRRLLPERLLLRFSVRRLESDHSSSPVPEQSAPYSCSRNR